MRPYVLAVALALINGLTGLCAAAETQEVKDAEQPTFTEAMDAYNKAAYEVLMPLVATAKGSELRGKMFAALAPVVEKHLVPHKDILMREAKRLLHELPTYDLGPADQWESALMTGQAQEDLQALWKREMAPSLPDGTSPSVVLLATWNPLGVARNARTMIMFRGGPAHQASNRIVAEFVAPPLVRAIAPDAESPVIAFVTGEEVVVISLKRTALGSYEPVEGRWLRAKKQTQPTEKKDGK